MSEQFKEYVKELNSLKQAKKTINKRFFEPLDLEFKYQSFYSGQENLLSAIDMSNNALFIDADIDTYVKWLIKEGG